MNKVLKLILCVLLGVVATACGPHYRKKNGRVYHYDWDGGGAYTKSAREVEGADAKSFKVVGSYFMGGETYAVDKNRAYIGHNAIAGADPATFRPIDYIYSADAMHVFRGAELFTDADPATFRTLADNYALDATGVYYKGETLAGANPSTFATLGHLYAKDRGAVYDEGVAMGEVADPATFRLLGRPDREINGWWSFLRDVAAPHDARYQWACDKYYYYREGRRVEGADRATFTLLDDDGDSEYARDARHVFFCGGKRPFVVEGADAATFEVFNRRNLARDRNRYYYEGKPVTYDEAVKMRLIKSATAR